MGGPRDCHTEHSESGPEGQISCAITYVGSKTRVQMNLLIKETWSHRCRKQTSVTKGGGVEEE